jgi:hypothetical protein
VDCIAGNLIEENMTQQNLSLKDYLVLRDRLIGTALFTNVGITDELLDKNLDKVLKSTQEFHDTIHECWIEYIKQTLGKDTAKKLKAFCETPLDLS